jgi:Tfp pilus assembly protein PilV
MVSGIRNQRGAVLFEAFVALMILSIGLTGVLRVFGQALFVGQRTEEKQIAVEGLQPEVFEWFAIAKKKTKLPSYERRPLVTQTGRQQSDEYEYTLSSKQLSGQVEDGKSIAANQFYEVQFEVYRGPEREILTFDTVIAQARE